MREDNRKVFQVYIVDILKAKVLKTEAKVEPVLADGLRALGQDGTKALSGPVVYPSVGLKAYVNPEAGEAMGSEVNWLARALLKGPKFA